MTIKPKQKPDITTKKRVVSILNEIKSSTHDFCLLWETIFKLTEKIST